MLSLSFTDLRLAEEFKNLNSIQILHPDKDELVKSVVVEFGFDIRHPLFYIPSKHRNLRGAIVIDFCVLGEISRDKRFRNKMDLISRIVVAGMTDPYLGKDMEELLGRTRSYNNEEISKPMSKKEKQYRIDNDFDNDEEEDSTEYVEEDYQETLEKIQQLADIRDHIRGVK